MQKTNGTLCLFPGLALLGMAQFFWKTKNLEP